MWIAVDVFGGDHAPEAILEGCKQALERDETLQLILSGDSERIARESFPADRVRILHAPEIIGCDEQPTLAIKRKKDSSLVRALKCVADGEAACIVSAGNTGAVLAGATLIIRRAPGVKRPALAPIIPTLSGHMLLLDSGANVDCKPAFLQQFAVMGAAYAEHVLRIENPRVGLINNGAEAEKGNELTKAAYPLLASAPVNFVGNCEAREILSGEYDVLVADGFTGNVVLKYTEGLAVALMSMLKDELLADTRSKIGAALAKPAFARFKKRMDYTEQGGAPLLGINSGVIKAHGSSNAKAFAAALAQAKKYVDGGVTEIITKAIAALPEAEGH